MIWLDYILQGMFSVVVLIGIGYCVWAIFNYKPWGIHKFPKPPLPPDPTPEERFRRMMDQRRWRKEKEFETLAEAWKKTRDQRR